ncbi:MAG: hypothetical protein IT317_13675 [Anaerolineales bacterium]|nr:hypothetical protein [Anaerolineales bacterium]
MIDLANYGDGALIDNLALALGPDARPVLKELRGRLRRLRLRSILGQTYAGPVASSQYTVEHVPNGYYRVQDRASGLTCLFDALSGRWRSGDLFRCSTLTIFDLGLATPAREVGE